MRDRGPRLDAPARGPAARSGRLVRADRQYAYGQASGSQPSRLMPSRAVPLSA